MNVILYSCLHRQKHSISISALKFIENFQIEIAYFSFNVFKKLSKSDLCFITGIINLSHNLIILDFQTIIDPKLNKIMLGRNTSDKTKIFTFMKSEFHSY